MRVALSGTPGTGKTSVSDILQKKGYEVAGPPIEVYTKKPEVVGCVTVLYAKVMMPVTKGKN